MTGAELTALLSRGRFSLNTESAAQGDVEQYLLEHLPAGVGFEREPILSEGERPDFIVHDGLVIELKVKGAQKMAIYRQLQRYAKLSMVREIILLTGVSMGLPPTIEGKPAYYVSMGRAWL